MSATMERLASQVASHRRVSALLDRATHERDEAIRAAVADGMTHAQIAEVTGLTRARVGQIALAKR